MDAKEVIVLSDTSDEDGSADLLMQSTRNRPIDDGILVVDVSNPTRPKRPTRPDNVPHNAGKERSEPVWMPGLRRIQSGSHVVYKLPMILRCQACFNYYMNHLGQVPNSSRLDSQVHFREAPGVHENSELPVIDHIPDNCQDPENCRMRPNTIRCDRCFIFYIDRLG